MKNWINKRIALNDTWGPGAVDSLTAPLGRMPEFAMRARHLRDAQGQAHCAHFSIDFSSGYLADGWQGVNFIPIGNTPVSGISGLPPWDPSVRDTYRKMIEAAAGTLADSRTERLEAVIPYMAQQGGLGYNRVRLFYVTNAVTGPEPDLVVIKIATHIAIPGTKQARQDGSAQGPPKK